MTSFPLGRDVSAEARPPSAADRGPARLPSLTGMRFISAALVFANHVALFGFFANPGTAQKIDALVSQGGFAGVTFFFILSGFVLTWSARPGDRFTSFWRRRFWKIYPSYLVALGLGILFALAFPGAIKIPVIGDGAVWNPGRAVLDALLLQSWHPDVLVRTSFNQPLWSLSAEAFFYLCFPVFLVVIGRVRPERLWAWTGGVVAAIFAVPAIATYLPPGPSFPGFPLTGTEVWLDIHFAGTRTLDFVFGILLARLVLTGRRLPLGLGGAVALAVTAYFLSSYVPPRFGVTAILVVPLGLVVAAGAVQDAAGRPSFLSGRVWVWLGEISYALYLLHYPVLMPARKVLGDRTLGSWTGLGLAVVLFAVTVVLSALLHHLVELPLMRRFSRSRRGREELAAAAQLRPATDPAGDERPTEPGRRAA